jgi:signal transduction histidine kinase
MMIRQILSNSLKYSQGKDIVIRSFAKKDHIALEYKPIPEEVVSLRFAVEV